MNSAAGGPLWEGSRSQLESLLADMGLEVDLRKMVFFLAPEGRLFGKREDGSWQEYDLPATTSSS